MPAGRRAVDGLKVWSARAKRLRFAKQVPLSQGGLSTSPGPRKGKETDLSLLVPDAFSSILWSGFRDQQRERISELRLGLLAFSNEIFVGRLCLHVPHRAWEQLISRSIDSDAQVVSSVVHAALQAIPAAHRQHFLCSEPDLWQGTACIALARANCELRPCERNKATDVVRLC